MRIIWTLLICITLSCCNGDKRADLDSAILAFQELKKSGGEGQYLIIVSMSNDQHYIQFKTSQGKIFFNRPILAASQPNLPIVPARFYKPVNDQPVIENAEIYRFLSSTQAVITKEYLNNWNLKSNISYRATEDENGIIVEYFENYDGLFLVPESNLREFIEGYFSEVFNIPPDKLQLDIITGA